MGFRQTEQTDIMYKVKILIVEDELLIAEDIRMQLTNLGYEVSGMAVSYNEAVDSIMQNLPDLVLVDIHIEGKKDGIELGDFLKNEAEIPFIYLTSYGDSATVERAKKTNPDAYLLKPFKGDNLFTSIEIALSKAVEANRAVEATQKLEDSENQDFVLKDCVFIKQDNIFTKIKLADILFIKSEGNYLYLYGIDGHKYLIRSSMGYFSSFLTDENFFQTHQSYIVNLYHVDEFSPSHVKIQDQEIPLSKSRKDNLFAIMRTI